VLQQRLFSGEDDSAHTIEKARVLIQREFVSKLLVNLIKVNRRFEATYSQVNVKKITENKFDSLNHLLMYQYNQIFEEILNWHEPEAQNQISQERQPNYDVVVESLVQAYADKSWTAFDAAEQNNPRDGQRNNRGRPAAAPDRVVTQQEIDEVTALGFD
jgi:hypothetical protein